MQIPINERCDDALATITAATSAILSATDQLDDENAGATSSSTARGDSLRKYLTPIPDDLDLTKESCGGGRFDVSRLSKSVIEIFIPEADPPTDWHQILEVKPSTIPNSGDGLFAKRRIPARVPLGFYFGIPMTEDEYDSMKDGVGVASDYSIMYRRTVLDATDHNGMPWRDPQGRLYCPFHFMNEDTERSNVEFTEGHVVNQVIVFTDREIKEGEEIFVNYGKDIHRHWKPPTRSSTKS